ncbi:unnamed protein product [Urochloa decumbens]|uniref:ALA-interacting subunit n=1 Tax=Urochloa decumbens TaxID=240449 RepID=A0ABC9ET21_9POAL
MPPVNSNAAGPSSAQDGPSATTKNRNKPRYHPFTQQELPACKPILTLPIAIAVIASVGIIFILIGLGCIASSNKVVEVWDRYETACIPKNMHNNAVACIQNPSEDKSCTRVLKVPKDMKKPIYIYYQLDRFYQNHRRYARSRSIRQLSDPKMARDTRLCKPEAAADGGAIVPCGLVAWSLFNDTYSFARGNETLAVNKRGISWRSDRNRLFGKHVYPRNFQSSGLIGGGTLDPSKPLSEQEDLMVWMRTAALPRFRKLYGRIDQVDLRAGDVVEVTVMNNYNTYSFGGRKAVVLSTAGALGGKSSFLGRAYLAGGAASLAVALLLTLLWLLGPAPVEPSLRPERR